MDQINRSSAYPALVKQALQEYKRSVIENALDPLPYELALIFDDEHQQYLVRKVGWKDNKRILKTVRHVALQNGKIRVEGNYSARS